MTKYRNDLNKNTGHRSLAFYLISVFCCLLIVGIGVVCFRLRGGVQVKASQDMGMQSEPEAVLYRQDDERWGENKLGDSKDTMRSSGCLVSCIASALSMESGEEETPGSLNEKISEKQVYDTRGNLQWQLLAEGEEYRVDVYEEVSADIIDTCLSQGHYPIVRVRMYALGNIHYVLIIGAKGGEYLCMDPLRDEITELSDYGSRVYAVRCVYYDEKNPERGEDGKALKPGAAFLFYTPDAAGHEPGTELYGAVEFLSWSPVQREFSNGSDKLDCYALHNLETGYGFFSAEEDSVRYGCDYKKEGAGYARIPTCLSYVPPGI